MPRNLSPLENDDRVFKYFNIEGKEETSAERRELSDDNIDAALTLRSS